MLTVLRELLSADAFKRYLQIEAGQSGLTPTYHSKLFLSGLEEEVALEGPDHLTQIKLSSHIIGAVPVSTVNPRSTASRHKVWRQNRRPTDDRYRSVVVAAGSTRASIHFDPVTVADGWQLARNQHYLAVEHRDVLVKEEIVTDSALHNAIRSALSQLLEDSSPIPFDLAPLARIAALAEHLREVERSQVLTND
jgi:hypothetical protein